MFGLRLSALNARGGPGRASWAAFAALLVLMTAAYVGHPPDRFTRGGRVHGDGVYYYSYLRSIAFDGDVDLANDYAALGNPHGRTAGPRGLVENPFTIGTAVLWAPTFAAAQAVVRTGDALGWIDDPCDGTSPLSQRITLYGSVLYAVLAALVTMGLARRHVGARWACVGAIAAVVATPLLWYAVYQPSFSHAASAFAVAVFVAAWDRGRLGRDIRGWAGLGALAGLMALVRPQDGLFALLAAVELGLLARRSPRAALVGAAVFAAAAALVFAPQMIVWAEIYGSPLTVPQGEDFMRWEASKWAFTLFSSRNGLIAWTPIVGLCLLGLLGLVVRGGRARLLAALLLVVFAGQAYVNGAVDDWWGGWAFGGRRFLGCTAMFGLGCAAFLAGLDAALQRRARAVIAGLVGGVAVLWGVCNVSLVDDYMYGELARGKSQEMRTIAERTVLRGLGWFYRVVGHPGAIPANWLFAWRAGVSPERYDAVSGHELVETRDNLRGRSEVWFDDPRWGMAGFGPQTLHLGERASMVEGTDATFVLPMRRAAPLVGTLRLAAASPDARVRIDVEGVTVLDGPIAPGWQSVPLAIPAEALGPGINFAAVRQTFRAEEPPPREVGHTGVMTTLEVTIESDPQASGGSARFSVGRSQWEVTKEGLSFLVLPVTQDAPLWWNTGVERGAADRFAAAIADLPAGTLVAVAISGHGAKHLTRPARAALKRLGGRQIPSSKRHDGYVLLGVKGAAVGSALEQRSPQGRAVLLLGRPFEARAVGVAWGRLALERPEP